MSTNGDCDKAYHAQLMRLIQPRAEVWDVGDMQVGVLQHLDMSRSPLVSTRVFQSKRTGLLSTKITGCLWMYACCLNLPAALGQPVPQMT
jgi:hypothetical protein